MDCASCPTKILESVSAAVQTTLFVRGLGYLPILQGDPKWLPLAVTEFIVKQAEIMCPSAIWLCNGSLYEADYLKDILIKRGVMEKLTAYEDVYLARTDPHDTVRVENKTFISTPDKSEVEAARKMTTECKLARWMSRGQLELEMKQRFPGCMRGRIMFVIPFSMGPIGGPFSRNAVQLSDSPYVVINMRMMTRVSSALWDTMSVGTFVRCVHSVGCSRPLSCPPHNGWLCRPDKILVAHLLPELEVYSYGSDYGGNSLLGKKCLSLRIGSYLGYKEGWLAEHAALLSLTNPDGKEIFFCFSCPSGVGKTALATMIPSIPGWEIRLLGDDITWLRWINGQLCAMAPENGMFGIAANVRADSGKLIIELEQGEEVLTWDRKAWTPGQPSSHPNCRFTVFTKAVSNVHPQWDGQPVPISAYIWGSHRPDAFPLVVESNSWNAGVTLAATLRTQVANTSDMTNKELVHDPMSMRPFMSYNFANYVKHWLAMGKDKKTPQTFHVNWYRTDEKGNVMWPGYGENIRVLEWIFNRVTQPATTSTVKTSIGQLPTKLNSSGLKDVSIEELIEMDKDFWRKEVAAMEDIIRQEMGDERPVDVDIVLEDMKKNLI